MTKLLGIKYECKLCQLGFVEPIEVSEHQAYVVPAYHCGQCHLLFESELIWMANPKRLEKDHGH